MLKLALPDVAQWLIKTASDADIEYVQNVIRQLRTIDEAVQVASVYVGMDTKIKGLSPKYLNGLCGAIKSIKGKRADILLDTKSTNALRYVSDRFVIPAKEKQHLLRGVPLSCCGN